MEAGSGLWRLSRRSDSAWQRELSRTHPIGSFPRSLSIFDASTLAILCPYRSLTRTVCSAHTAQPQQFSTYPSPPAPLPPLFNPRTPGCSTHRTTCYESFTYTGYVLLKILGISDTQMYPRVLFGSARSRIKRKERSWRIGARDIIATRSPLEYASGRAIQSETSGLDKWQLSFALLSVESRYSQIHATIGIAPIHTDRYRGLWGSEIFRCLAAVLISPRNPTDLLWRGHFCYRWQDEPADLVPDFSIDISYIFRTRVLKKILITPFFTICPATENICSAVLFCEEKGLSSL